MEIKLQSIENPVFLAKKIELEMFTPCGGDGQPLAEPQMRPERNSFDEEDMDYDAQELYEYIQAKEKVLFKGFEIHVLLDGNTKRLTSPNGSFNVAWYNEEKQWYLSGGVSDMKIRDLQKYGLELTESAINNL